MEFWTTVYLLLCASAGEPSSSFCHHFAPQCQQLSHAVMLTIIIIKRTNKQNEWIWYDYLQKWQCEHLVLKIKAGIWKTNLNTKTLGTLHLLCLVVPSVLHPVIHYPRVFHRHSGCNVKWIWHCVGLGFRCFMMDFIKSWVCIRNALTLLNAFSTYFGKPTFSQCTL